MQGQRDGRSDNGVAVWGGRGVHLELEQRLCGLEMVSVARIETYLRCWYALSRPDDMVGALAETKCQAESLSRGERFLENTS